MKKLILSVMIVSVLALSSIVVFADGNNPGASADILNDIFAKVTGAKSSKISELKAQGIGYGRLIPASILSKKLGISLEEATVLKEFGQTYAKVAQDNGITLEDFKKEMLESKNSMIDERVKAGLIPAEQGDALKERIKDNIANCDGTTANREDVKGIIGNKLRGIAGQSGMGGKMRGAVGKGMVGGKERHNGGNSCPLM